MNHPSPRRALVTGAAGFVGFHVAARLLADGWRVLGVDNFTPYYDVALKEGRAARLSADPLFRLERCSIEDFPAFEAVWGAFEPEIVLHLAAQAGVRYSIEEPAAYVGANVSGSFHVLELARRMPVRHLLAASTSSVYGANPSMPFEERDRAAEPLTLYAATKGAMELMAHAYAHLYRTPTTCFRFFTVYGPWGRPDMALFKFARAMLADEPIEVYNGGDMLRDFTYVDDLIEAVTRLVPLAPQGAPAVPGDSLSPIAPFRVVNIGCGQPVRLTALIEALEAALGRKARKTMLPMQPGDAPATFASPALLRALTGYAPHTPISEGVPKFVAWYRSHFG